MKKSLSIETMFGDVSFYDRFARVRAAGFDCVELEDWTELDITRVRRELSDHRLILTGISGARNHSLANPAHREDFLEFLSQTIAVARNFGCANIVIASEAEVSASARFGVDRKDDFDKMTAITRALMEAAQKAAKAGMTLLIRPFGQKASAARNAGSAPSAADVVRVINSPALRLLYEVRVDETEDGMMAEGMRKYRDLVEYVRVVDSEKRSGSEGCGESFSRIRKALDAELAYNGVVCFEMRSGSGEKDCIEEIRAF